MPDFRHFADWLRDKRPNDYWLMPDVPDDYAAREQARLTGLWQQGSLPCRVVTWSVTNRCNLRCHHCGVYGGEREYDDLTLVEFARCIPDMLRMGVKYVVLTGGEPLTRPDLPQILELLRLSGFKIGLVTGAYGLEAWLPKLPHEPVQSLSISIDGIGATHDRMRGREGSFERAIAGIGQARSLGVPLVTVATCVHADNLAELPALRDRLFAAGINHWILRPIAPVGRAREGGLGLSDDQIMDLLRFAKTSLTEGFDLSVADLGHLGPWDSVLNLGPYFCSIGWDSLNLLPNGDVKGLAEDHLPVEGNVRQESLAAIWQRGFQRYRQPDLPAMCGNCPAFGRCQGGFVPVADGGRRCIRPLFGEMAADD